MSIEKTSTGTYRVRWREGGRNRAKTIGRKRDAELFEAEIVRRRRMGDLASLDSGKQTLQEFAETTWWPEHVKSQLERSTRTSYASTWDRHIGPELGGYPLRELSAPLVRRFLADLRARGVGPQAIRRVKAILQSCLSRAVEQGLIQGNPAAGVKLPRAERRPSVPAIGPTQVEALRAELCQRDAALVSVLAYACAPAKRSRCAGPDIAERTILVERANDDGQVKATKTGRRRTTRLMAPVKADLVAWRLASGRSDDHELVFLTAAGGPWREHDWRNWRRRIFQPACAELVFPNTAGVTSSRAQLTSSARSDSRALLDLRRPYDLRHAAASLWLHEGRSVVEVAAWLGHSPAMCPTTYAHVVDELRDAPRINAEDAIRAARDRDVPTLYPQEVANA